MNDENAILFADFETTVENNVKEQMKTEVWSAAYISGWCENTPENVIVRQSIDEFMDDIDNLSMNTICYFHNLKFDGSFILTYLLKNNKWKADLINGKMNTGKIKLMKMHRFRYMISSKGMWYSITLRNKNKKLIRIWDSTKLLPQSLENLGKAFKTRHQKLSMEYKGHRYPGCVITEEEKQYICNDVLVLKECMEHMFSQGIDNMTIGSACLQEFKKGFTDEEYEKLFPDLTKIPIPDYGDDKDRSYDYFIRKSYHGGFCYVNPKYQGQVIKNFVHVDANSHYPSQMHSESGNYYPVGVPSYYHDEQITKDLLNTDTKNGYYFVRFECEFTIRPKKIPCVQIKDNPIFHNHYNEWLESSYDNVVDMTMTCVDFKRFRKSYHISKLKIKELVMFETKIGLFDTYINHWYEIKENSTGPVRVIAKLFLNNLYGKFASSTDSSYKIAEYVEGKGLRYYFIQDNNKDAGYIAIGSAITSYCRNVTIGFAEMNYKHFVYSDTDSLVLLCKEEEIKGIPIHQTKLCYWGVESVCERGIFTRQKTYIEQIDGAYNIKCAGMGKVPKQRLSKALETNNRRELGLDQKGSFKLKDFTEGLIIDGNIKACNKDGGVLLVDNFYKLR